MIWFIILTIVANDGTVYTEVRPASNPEYNNQETCHEVGKILADKKQMEIGTTSGKVYYICESFSKEEVSKVLTIPGQDI